MEKEIINFSDFLKDKKTQVSPTKENDILIEEEVIEIPEIENNSEIEESDLVKESIDTQDNSETEESNEELSINVVNNDNDNYYPIFKDKLQEFNFDVTLEGDANINNTEARLILESDDWSLIFMGEIDSKGTCVIPIKKLSILNEGVIGKIRVEVIADSTIFVPWEDQFKVKLSKKVTVKLNETKSAQKKVIQPTKPSVKINVKR